MMDWHICLCDASRVTAVIFLLSAILSDPSLNNSIRNSYFTQAVNQSDARIKIDGFKKLTASQPWPRIRICKEEFLRNLSKGQSGAD